MGTLLHKYEDHKGPVRGIDFHPTQPIFVSAGDDYNIKVWSLETHKCLYTLNGHLDYVRTVFFHHELPWIISASDDQTIRIWNWQNRKELACITGHNHFVMCAQFHPNEDLVVSASLDETVRVWDISGLRKRHSAPGNNGNSFEEQMLQQQQSLLDAGFGDCVIKFILVGHTRGVNWASFHPTLPLIVSGSDDRQVKIWRMSSNKAWEVDTCRGHSNNVDCVIFHPHQNVIISAGEDKTLRIWDLEKRTPIKQFKRDNDRFWLVRPHPNINLFGAAHDSGIMVFKLDRERPCSFIHMNQLIYVNKEKQVQLFDFTKKVSSLPYASLAKIGHMWNAFRSMSYNPSQHSILISEGNDRYALVVLPKTPTGAVEPTTVIEDSGSYATFVARNRFVCYSKSNETLEVRSLDNKVTKTAKLDSGVKDIVYTGPGTVLILYPREVILYDVQQGRKIAELAVKNVKYVMWSPDGQYVALMSKHTITIATKRLELINSMHETIRIKSAAWDETNVLIYSTLNHIRYSLLNGDRGIIKTLEKTLYVIKVQGHTVYTLNREAEIEILSIDPTEYRFKKALVNKNFPEVLRIIKSSHLVGQNIISYLQKSGYPEIALQFVTDPETRFDLALECGNLDVALEEANKLQNTVNWDVLNKEAIAQGNIGLSEMIYQNQHAFDKLSFLYLISGDKKKLDKMEKIAEHRGDIFSMLQNSYYNNSGNKRAEIFANNGSLQLAYAVSKARGDDEAATRYLEQAGIDEQDVALPAKLSQDNFAKIPTNENVLEKWPLKDAELSYFEKAVLGQVNDLSLDEPIEENTQNQEQVQPNNETDNLFQDVEDTLEENDAWDLNDEDLVVDEAPEKAIVEGVPKSVTEESEVATWVKNAKLPGVLVAAGAFDAAAQALSKQLGIVDFKPLKPYFINTYDGARSYMSSTPTELPAVAGYIRVNADDIDASEILPYISKINVITDKLNEGFKHFKANKLELAIESFRDVIYRVIFLAVSNEEDELIARRALYTAKEYILGLSIELERRSLPDDQVKRNLELAAYFTRAKLAPAHRSNALQVAMSQNFKNKNYVQASYFAGEFLKIMTSGPRADQARKIKDKADSLAHDAIELDFDPYAEFEICAATHTPIYKGMPSSMDPLTNSMYHESEKGKRDSISLVSKIGAPASGLRIQL